LDGRQSKSSRDALIDFVKNPRKNVKQEICVPCDSNFSVEEGETSLIIEEGWCGQIDAAENPFVRHGNRIC
jgi:hypothetical protein